LHIPRLLTPLHRFGAACYRFFRSESFDLIYCLNYHDAAAAILAGFSRPKLERPRIVYHAVGIPLAAAFRAVPHDRLAFQLCGRCSEFLVVSSFARHYAKIGFGIDATLLPPPVRVNSFATGATARPEEPVFAFVGDVDEPRKGAVALARAFAAVVVRLPDARLVYCGRATAARQDMICRAVAPEVAARIVFTGVAQIDDVRSVYASASVVVLPAAWESFGLVLVEALASGTPVVGCRHGGIPDIITDPRIGRLFDPGEIGKTLEPCNDQALTRALLEAHALSCKSQTRELCMAHARSFSWDALGPRYDALLDRVGTQ
jgi:phosphatidylinositol alpha-mannosyltransferase